VGHRVHALDSASSAGAKVGPTKRHWVRAEAGNSALRRPVAVRVEPAATTVAVEEQPLGGSNR
jgi:hypothetical protein